MPDLTPHRRDPAASWPQIRDAVGAALGGIWTFLIRALPIVAGYIAYHAAGTAAISKAHEAAIRDLGTAMQWAIGLIAGIAAYTLIGEFTLKRLPRDFRRLETEVAALRDITSEQVAIAQALRGLEIVYEFDDALKRARRLQNSASTSVHAMWALLPYDDALRSYFRETLAAGPFTKRVIAANNVSKADLMDHISESWAHLASGRYEIYVVHQCNYEAMVIDKKRAGLFFNSERGFGSGYISSPTEEFGRMVEGLVEDLTKPAAYLTVKRNSEPDLDSISQWLDTFY